MEAKLPQCITDQWSRTRETDAEIWAVPCGPEPDPDLAKDQNGVHSVSQHVEDVGNVH